MSRIRVLDIGLAVAVTAIASATSTGCTSSARHQLPDSASPGATSTDKSAVYKGMTIDEIEAKAEAGDTYCQALLGLCLYRGNFTKATEFYLNTATQDNSAVQCKLLGWIYESGTGVEKDEAKAVQWYRKAADQGNADAQDHLGWMYVSGTGVTQDEAEAANWYRKAADQGYANAQLQLGLMYKIGSGVEANEAEAVKWLLKAAEQGCRDAEFILGCMGY